MKIQVSHIYKKIQKAFDDGFTTVSAQGSSRSSKTTSIVIWLCVYAQGHDDTSISIVRETLPALKGSVLRDFRWAMQLLGLWEDKRFKKGDLMYEFDNGSYVEFFSCSDEQRLRGRKRNILFVNEANELTFLEWQQLQMRTTLFSILDYNPSFNEEHWINQVNKENKTFFFISTYKDNPFLEQKVIDEIESLQWKNPSLWRVYGLGLQAIIEGLVFENVEIIDEIPRWCKKHRFLGMDIGYSQDPTAIVEVCITDDALYIDEVCYQTKMLTSDITDVIKDKIAQEHYKFKVISESADPRLIDEVYNAGIDIHPVRKYAGSIMAGINKMKEYKICITKRSVNLIRESKNYTYRKDKNGNWMNEPIDAFNHGNDAVRYVILEEVLGKNSRSLTADELLDIL